MSNTAIPDFSGHLVGPYRLTALLGSGNQGVVYRAMDTSAPSASCKLGGGDFAVKILAKAGPSKLHTAAQRLEIHVHQRMSSHPNVLTMHVTYEDPEYYYLVTDYCAGGDLYTQIFESRVFEDDEERLRRTFLQIVDAVEACHEQKIYHRDLKPENILCSEDGSQVYLGDFGLARTKSVSQEFGFGTEFYMSPECIGEQLNYIPYSNAYSDIWSLGIILVNMISGGQPWIRARTDVKEFCAFMFEPDYFLRTLPITAELNDILRKVLAFNPLSRISLPAIREAITNLSAFRTDPTDTEDIKIVVAPASPPEPPTPGRSQSRTCSIDDEDLYMFPSADSATPAAFSCLALPFSIRAHQLDYRIVHTIVTAWEEEMERRHALSCSRSPSALPECRFSYSMGTLTACSSEDSLWPVTPPKELEDPVLGVRHADEELVLPGWSETVISPPATIRHLVSQLQTSCKSR